MPLYLATHTVHAVTATVPLAMVVLADFVKRKALPNDLHVRLVLPTSGTVSVSVWDAPSTERLLEWLHANLAFDESHEVYEVQEEFSVGLAFELARARAAEKVAAGSRSAMDRISSTAAKAGKGFEAGLEALDNRTGFITAAAAASEQAMARLREATSTSSPASEREVDPGHNGAARPPEQKPLSSTSQMLSGNVAASLSKAGANLTWFGQSIRTALGNKTSPLPDQMEEEQPRDELQAEQAMFRLPSSTHASGDLTPAIPAIPQSTLPRSPTPPPLPVSHSHSNSFSDQLAVQQPAHPAPLPLAAPTADMQSLGVEESPSPLPTFTLDGDESEESVAPAVPR
eukprot:CAMPEP_0119104920 /NCGR_PEP_ID=MMETSP1180-20130426/3004_1 /TAXON_ID=3052 ORGANISM="Chlamydomonas cf sp, Strain CCMP681" /NCGR_SAMPLE_ID=MMETSP1180 /ASSEMBLY_ACC=CAM_ASM_000741 /LENGTH=342 /DNA_ID=CAMNT_0007089803 /DNA_START=12 /DNA_END=1040 /DNA_ORIENTATION=-